MKEFFVSSKIRNSDTFWKELEKLNISKYVKRRNIHGKKKTCVDIYYSDFRTVMGKCYPGFEIQPWQHVENFTEFTNDLLDFQNDSRFRFE